MFVLYALGRTLRSLATIVGAFIIVLVFVAAAVGVLGLILEKIGENESHHTHCIQQPDDC